MRTGKSYTHFLIVTVTDSQYAFQILTRNLLKEKASLKT